MARKVLKCYPFARLINPPVKLVEGFKVYDGYLGDERGREHKGIDYVRVDEKGRFLSFEVFSSHNGNVFRGRSDSWGNFVKVCQEIKNLRFETIYAHLESIPKEFSILPKAGEPKNKGMIISQSRYLGKVGTSGDTKGNIQLHFELQIKNLKTGKRKRVDPYGIYDRYTSGKYPQPGESLKRGKHYWTSNRPLFADEV